MGAANERMSSFVIVEIVNERMSSFVIVEIVNLSYNE